MICLEVRSCFNFFVELVVYIYGCLCGNSSRLVVCLSMANQMLISESCSLIKGIIFFMLIDGDAPLSYADLDRVFIIQSLL